MMMFIKKAFLLSLLLSLSLLHGQPDLTQIQQLVDSTREAENVPAISLGIVHRGQTYFVNGGVLEHTHPSPVDEHSIYQIASLGKPLVGLVANALLLENKIKIDQPITGFLEPKFSNKRWAKLEQITLRHLLHHTAGLPHDVAHAYRRKDGEPYDYIYQEKDFYADLARVKLKSPGKYQYSNFGFALAAFLLEQATKTPYPKLVEQYLSGPLKMADTSPNPASDQLRRLVTPYRKDDRSVPTGYWTMGKMAPPSGWYSTTHDMCQLLQVQIQAYRRYQEDQVITPMIISHDLHTKGKDPRDAYGYGIQAWDNTLFGHAGDMDGFASFYTFYPAQNYGFVLLTSSGEDWIMPLVGRLHGILGEQ
jgi:CubicO group peptidase (beta-lactamase class C family)